MSESKLTGKQYSFCVEYVRSGGNQSEAYRNSLYDASKMKAETITNNAYKLMQNNDVLTTIQELKAETMNDVKESLKIELNDVIKGIAHISKNAKRDSDKLKAFDMLMKHLGGYDQKEEKKDLGVNIPITHWTKTGGTGSQEDFDKAFGLITFHDFEKENKEYIKNSEIEEEK